MNLLNSVDGLASRFCQWQRQLLVPREFRITRPAWPVQLGDRLAKAIETAARAAADSARAVEAAAAAQEEAAKRQLELPPMPDINATLQERLKFLADVGTGLWRMRRNMVSTDFRNLLEARPLEEMRKPFRWLVSTWDVLKESGLEIQDHRGDRYISGQSVKAHFEAAPDLHEDTIIETIKPTIYFDGKIIQMGEVVVGTPDLAEPHQPQSPPAPAPEKSPTGGKSYFAT
jgi:hypothetical protein